jgi:hypothetical protein
MLYRQCVGKFGKPGDFGELKCMILNQINNSSVTPIQSKFLISEGRPCHLAKMLPDNFDQLFSPLKTLMQETKVCLAMGEYYEGQINIPLVKKCYPKLFKLALDKLII